MDIILSCCIPFFAWIAYPHLSMFSQPAFRWAFSHLVALAWIQLGVQMLLFLNISSPWTLGIWFVGSLLWIRPQSIPCNKFFLIYIVLIPYFLLAIVPPWYRDTLTYHLTLPKLFAARAGGAAALAGRGGRGADGEGRGSERARHVLGMWCRGDRPERGV